MINKLKFVNPCSMWIIVVIGILLVFLFVPRIALFEVNFFSFILFLLCLAVFLYLFGSALKVNKEVILSSNETSRIIKTGIYSKTRHPIYTGDIILYLGIFLLFPYLSFLISFLWLALVLFLWMNLEELILARKFGKEYIEYRKKVPMIILKVK